MKKTKDEFFNDLKTTLLDGDVLKVEGNIIQHTNCGILLSEYDMSKEEITYY